mmetsp:Transcript_10050/g.19184  ORF Transcript_10050/g.19184 Transcript_10050/m.19184 type:complete len:238 (-) Transcript_10050:56-769(-)
MMGMPPHTAASYRNSTSEEGSLPSLTSSRTDSISTKSLAMRALLAVTTSFPARSEANTTSLASVVPPITSTTMSMSSSSKMSEYLSVMVQPSGTSKSRGLDASRTHILDTSRLCPVRSVKYADFLVRMSTMPPPTVPPPKMPILMVVGGARIMRMVPREDRGAAVVVECAKDGRVTNGVVVVLAVKAEAAAARKAAAYRRKAPAMVRCQKVRFTAIESISSSVYLYVQRSLRWVGEC